MSLDLEVAKAQYDDLASVPDGVLHGELPPGVRDFLGFTAPALLAEVDRLRELLEQAHGERDQGRDLAAALEAQNAAALALHQPYLVADDDQVFHCGSCRDAWHGRVPYPCPTVRALGVEPDAD